MESIYQRRKIEKDLFFKLDLYLGKKGEKDEKRKYDRKLHGR